MSKGKRGREAVRFKVQCVTCGCISEIEGDKIDPGDVPYCDKDFSPMIVLGVTVERIPAKRKRGTDGK
ncbi:MAG: hypothetical protein WBA09_22160 [Candidatus Acidiferrum sp.]